VTFPESHSKQRIKGLGLTQLDKGLLCAGLESLLLSYTLKSTPYRWWHP
jgi:hypothetical protein